MRDHLLFAVAPYVGAMVFVTVFAVRSALLPPRPQRLAPRPLGHDRAFSAGWRTAAGVIAVGHLLALAAPDYVLLWDRRLIRLALLEGAGVIAGLVAAAGTIAAIVRRLREADRDRAPSPVEVVAATLAVVGMVSGVGIAVFYRWASSWSAVTLVPYLHSLARLDPSMNLVTRLPPLVKLHVISAFFLLAIVPFTDMARAVLDPVDRLRHRTLATIARAFRPAWLWIERWTETHMRTALVIVIRNRDEEN